ncbi:arginyl-tRNA synthetase [Mycetocola sp.]|uniref:arginyl-tRNA synthetase n=1 Tax=Mycetocola sp. TaxID=1871042 RepID=UPI0039898BD8
MASTFARTSAFRPLAVTAAVLGSLLLAGCTPAPTASSSGTPAPAETGPAETASETPTPASTATAVVSEPVDIGCDALITPADMYAFNPNISFVAEATPKAASTASEIAAMKGLTCQWANNSSNTTIEVGVAKLSEKDLTDLKNRAVTESKQVPTYAAPPVEGYFTVVGNEGEAQIFTGSYWVTLRAVDFVEPGDAEQLAEAAIAHLP